LKSGLAQTGINTCERKIEYCCIFTLAVGHELGGKKTDACKEGTAATRMAGLVPL